MLLIIVFVYDLLVDHESCMEFSNVCILELVLFIADGEWKNGKENGNMMRDWDQIKFIDSHNVFDTV